MVKPILFNTEMVRAILDGRKTVTRLLSLPDVRPVVRGQWINGICSECGNHAPYWCMATTYHETDYCPNCGAKMNEEANND